MGMIRQAVVGTNLTSNSQSLSEGGGPIAPHYLLTGSECGIFVDLLDFPAFCSVQTAAPEMANSWSDTLPGSKSAWRHFVYGRLTHPDQLPSEA